MPLELDLDSLSLSIDLEIGHLIELLFLVHDSSVEVGSPTKNVTLLLLLVHNCDSTSRSYPNVFSDELISSEVHVLMVQIFTLGLPVNPVDAVG